MVAGSNLSWQGIKRKAVYTEEAGPVCKCTGQCTLEGNVQSGGYCLKRKAVYTGGVHRDLGVF